MKLRYQIKRKNILNEDGQTTVEYILLFSVVVIIGIFIWGRFSSYMSETFGDFNQTISASLSTGTCPDKCFFQGYANAKR